MRVAIRAARADELSYLQAKADQQLPAGYEPLDLDQGVTYVADDDGVLAGMTALRLMWHVEPLILFPEFRRYAPAAGQKRATYLLGKAAEEHVADPARNCGARDFFAHLDDPAFEKLAVEFGLWKAYRAGSIYRGGKR